MNDNKPKSTAKERLDVGELIAALEAADRWLDGWCPTATCCASSGLKVHLQIREALANFRG